MENVHPIRPAQRAAPAATRPGPGWNSLRSGLVILSPARWPRYKPPSGTLGVHFGWHRGSTSSHYFGTFYLGGLMLARLQELQAEAQANLDSINDLPSLHRVKMIGWVKTASSPSCSKPSPLSPEDRKTVGSGANQIKAMLTERLAQRSRIAGSPARPARLRPYPPGHLYTSGGPPYPPNARRPQRCLRVHGLRDLRRQGTHHRARR